MEKKKKRKACENTKCEKIECYVITVFPCFEVDIGIASVGILDWCLYSQEAKQ